MQKRHQDREQYFKEQGRTTQKFVIPFVEAFVPVNPQTRILEIGCGEGGNLTPFLELGCDVTGVDIAPSRIANAKKYFQGHPNEANLRLVVQDIYKTNPDDFGRFDLIILRDVIEHLPGQERFMHFVKDFLTEKGRIFFGFPPWYMPFGGHQQICRHRWLSKLPYVHLLPAFLYKTILKAAGEPEPVVRELLELKETGISIERFRRIVKQAGYQIDREQLYLINPNYETKFNLKPRKQVGLIAALPFLRNFLTTCCYCVISLPVEQPALEKTN